MINFFLRKRHKLATQPNHVYVKAQPFLPGAEGFSYEPTTTTTPDFLTRVHPQLNFTPLRVYQPTMNEQLLSLPPSPPQGFPFGGFQPTGLIDSTAYPDVEGDFYQ